VSTAFKKRPAVGTEGSNPRSGKTRTRDIVYFSLPRALALSPHVRDIKNATGAQKRRARNVCQSLFLLF
jgi:hypothetical protein